MICREKIYSSPLSPEQRGIADGLLHFVVKDKDMFSVSNTFVGEAYLHFSEIPDTPAPIGSLPQQHLPLSKPNTVGKNRILLFCVNYILSLSII